MKKIIFLSTIFYTFLNFGSQGACSQAAQSGRNLPKNAKTFLNAVYANQAPKKDSTHIHFETTIQYLRLAGHSKQEAEQILLECFNSAEACTSGMVGFAQYFKSKIASRIQNNVPAATTAQLGSQNVPVAELQIATVSNRPVEQQPRPVEQPNLRRSVNSAFTRVSNQTNSPVELV